jgi:hypothetical protein
MNLGFTSTNNPSDNGVIMECWTIPYLFNTQRCSLHKTNGLAWVGAAWFVTRKRYSFYGYYGPWL